jgi:hypothetical protein
MCLIVVKPAGQDIPDHVIESARDFNSDGFGIMHNGTSKRWKHRTAAQIKELLDPMTDINCAVHFRMATDGKVCVANSHPFKLRNQAYLMHNGILTKYRTTSKANKSDTREFIDKFCNPMIRQHGSIPRGKLESEIVGNAIAIMQRDGTINTYGDSWLERYGCQFSNTYAWDSGSWSGFYSSSGLTSSWDTSEYASSRTRDSGPVDMGDTELKGLLGTIYHRLYDIADMLPCSNYAYVAYEDLDLQESLIADEIDNYKFLALCTEETLLELYTFACNGHLI